MYWELSSQTPSYPDIILSGWLGSEYQLSNFPASVLSYKGAPRTWILVYSKKHAKVRCTCEMLVHAAVSIPVLVCMNSNGFTMRKLDHITAHPISLPSENKIERMSWECPKACQLKRPTNKKLRQRKNGRQERQNGEREEKRKINAP